MNLLRRKAACVWTRYPQVAPEMSAIRAAVTFWRLRQRHYHVNCSNPSGISFEKAPEAGVATAGAPLMTRGIGTLFLGAAMMSLFSAAPKAPRRPKAHARRGAVPVPTPVDHGNPDMPSRLLALVQTKPHTMVLAISESREELERELLELNETWNHWELRNERQRYEIQPAPVLRRVREPQTLRRTATA